MHEVAFILAISFHCSSASPLLIHNVLLSRAANTTVHSPTAWANNPSGRGTEDILYSCFSTLFLCAWTAFHPNIQFVDSTFWALLRRLRWMLVAIVLPEAVLFSACSQWWAAKDLRDQINRLGQQNFGPSRFTTFAKWRSSECVACNPCKNLEDCFTEIGDVTINRQNHERCECLDGFRTDDGTPYDTTREFSQHRHVHGNIVQKPKAFVPWTMDQAFFAVSGGVALDTSSFWKRPHMTLTPNGIILLAEIGLLPCFSKQDVQDRSRADALAKSISCLQATWFFIQGLARVSAGLPLTLLELHTMTHIICALAMYAVWFSKPYGATSPMICSEPSMVNLAALLTLRCNTGRFNNRWRCSLKSEIPLRSVRCFHADANDEEVSIENDAEVSIENDEEVSIENDEEVSIENDEEAIEDDEEVSSENDEAMSSGRHEEVSSENDEGVSCENHEEVSNEKHEGDASDNDEDISIENAEEVSSENDEEVFVHLDAANKAIDFLRKRNIHLPFAPVCIQVEKGIEFEEKFLVNNVSNILVRGRFNNGVNKLDTPLARILILVFALLYCGSHLSAWNFHFPTLVEMWMWRGACFTMLCAPPLFVHCQIIMNPYGSIDTFDDQDEDKWDDRSVMDKTRIVFKYGFFVVHFTLAYLVLEKLFLFSRLYLLAESLASLRSPANGTYTSVDWTEYLPHFS